MKIIKIVLFIIGSFLIIIGFIQGYAKDYFPDICNNISPSYRKGTMALNKLIDATKPETERVIRNGEEGFDVLSNLFFKENWMVTGNNITDKKSIKEFQGIGIPGSFWMPGGAQIPSTLIIIRSDKDKNATILSYEISKSLDKLINKNLFILGIILTVLGIFLFAFELFVDQ